MGDVGEMGAALRDCRQERHAEWHEQNMAALRASGLLFVERETAELFRDVGKPRVDFFLSTGRWRVVGAGKTKPMRGGAKAFLAWYSRQAATKTARQEQNRCECGADDWCVSATLIACRSCGRTWGRCNGTWVLCPETVPEDSPTAPVMEAANG